MNIYRLKSLLAGVLLLLAAGCNNAPAGTGQANDGNTPLHLMQPAYSNPYGIPTEESVKEVLDRILRYLDSETPTQAIDARSGKRIDLNRVDEHAALQRGAFRLASYEWGVTYAGMLLVAKVTDDARYRDYTLRRLTFLRDAAEAFKQQPTVSDAQLRQMIDPQALDDAGAMCAAFIKASALPGADSYDPIIRNYMRWIVDGQLRLADGTLARNRPHLNTLWLDDLFMSIPALVNMGRYTGEQRYYDEAMTQLLKFEARMFVPEKNLFMHGWVEGMDEHPAFFWARANGWALMTMTEMLETLPVEYEGYPDIMTLIERHIQGIAALQSGDGLWHQLLDRNDSYLETSASAIYVYAMARAVNTGLIDAEVYGPRIVLAWNAVSQQVNARGQVGGVCVGTGMAFDPAYYYHRPVSVFAAHGYGPVLLAGAEIITMLRNTHPKMNDNALQFYDKSIPADAPIFDEPTGK
jgi:rhamnogalacturonyl hydrolase YesR